MAACWKDPVTAVPLSDTHFHSIARRTCHDILFIRPPQPHVTPGVNLPRYYTPTLCVLLSPLLYFCSSCRSLSGFECVKLCLRLSICVFICLTHIHLKGMLLSWMHRLSRQWEEITPPSSVPADFKSCTLNTHRDTQHAAYDGLFWDKKHGLKWILTDSDVYWGKSLSLQGLALDLRLSK